jgi:urease accessory protein
VRAPFQPEGGAYGDHGHSHNHNHNHEGHHHD